MFKVRLLFPFGIIFLFLNHLFYQLLAVSSWISRSESKCIPNSFHHLSTISYLSTLSLICGIIGTCCLFIRMLEKKIKWSLLIFIIAALFQGIISTLLSTIFLFTGTHHLQNYNCRFIYGFTYSILCAIISITIGLLTMLKLKSNNEQYYQYNLYDLSPNQRQLIMICIANIGYISLTALIYGMLENWQFTNAVYFVTSTFATIGLGKCHSSNSILIKSNR